MDLAPSLDAVYEALMGLRAEGGGDGPESVKEALHEREQAHSRLGTGYRPQISP